MTRQRRRSRRSACVLALTLTATACGSDRSETAAPLLNEDAIALSVIDIRADGCGPQPGRGTGTVIDDDGLVVTAAHVVAGAGTIEATDTSGTTSPAEVVYFDPAADVAAIRLSEPLGARAAVRAEPVTAGEQGIVIVHGDDGPDDGIVLERIDVEVLRRVTIATTDIYLDADVERSGFEIDASIEPGDSGAMVHLPGGGVGIVWARSTVRADHAWAVRLPDTLTDPAGQAALTAAVDPGPCT